MKIANRLLGLLVILNFCLCSGATEPDTKSTSTEAESPGRPKLLVGAERFDQYFPLLKDKKIGMVVNQTSVVGHPATYAHVVDTLLSYGFNITTIFAPEHGFRGDADAGAHVDNGKDAKTGLPIISLYGKNKKPTPEQLAGLDVVIFDIQDVGARFYTYISTMHYVMEACAEQHIPLIVLDRPNPNGFYVDGPIRKPEYQSFVGMDPIPVVHGLTVGELAKMINGEHWLENGVQCDLTVIPCQGYDHNTLYRLRIKPSPNLPNMTSIYLYPSLCFFEGTIMSVGRGTDFPFQVVGQPDFVEGKFDFTPHSMPGATNPLYKDETCHGYDLRSYENTYFLGKGALELKWLIETYNYYRMRGDDKKFFNKFFDTLAGTDELRKQLEGHNTEEDIRQSWHNDLVQYMQMRKQYLLYNDFTR